MAKDKSQKARLSEMVEEFVISKGEEAASRQEWLEHLSSQYDANPEQFDRKAAVLTAGGQRFDALGQKRARDAQPNLFAEIDQKPVRKFLTMEDVDEDGIVSGYRKIYFEFAAVWHLDEQRKVTRKIADDAARSADEDDEQYEEALRRAGGNRYHPLRDVLDRAAVKVAAE